MKYLVDIQKGTLEGKYEFEAENEFDFSKNIAELISYLICDDFKELNLIKIRKVVPLNEGNNV